ncbi:MAG: Nif11-like leader peptide family RiPP precursor [Scytonematopsis contorta HA4267-MV1]|nr:Nif11-like leader peptide family RiPP precursor [Scytonematopsis contorta HA4267-MV1]
MSNNNIEQFYNLVQNSPELQEQLGTAENQQSFYEMASQLGSENGYSFSAGEAETFMTQRSLSGNSELSDEELEAVAGGKKKCLGRFTTVCFISKQCWGSVC